jgi:succinate dehydrogenase / fumarate reductase cytochrome b subunit
MKINRPLSPHLTIYKPQLTSSLSIFHRITGAFLASMFLLTIFVIKVCDLSLSIYPIYWFVFTITHQLNWILFGFLLLFLLAFSYHMSNGIRHLTWDLGFALDLSKVYLSGYIMLCSAALVASVTITWLILLQK